MDMLNKIFMNLWAIVILYIALATGKTDDVAKHPGHLKAFGFTEEWNKLQEVTSFPSTEDFFTNYVFKSKPLKMIGVVKDSSPCKLWNDDYFLAMPAPKESVVHVKNEKKENRSCEVQVMHFHEFIKKYQTSDIYMLGQLPDYMGKDVSLPDSLQCAELYEKQHLGACNVWISSGGTKSVVHTIAAENLICVYQGDMQFILVDPQKYRHKVDIDNPASGYSDIDVEQVDMTKYPDLVDVEYYKTNLTAGDCIYIPYKWIQQVNSYHRNIAVSTMWDHKKGEKTDFKKCTEKPTPLITMDQMEFYATYEITAEDITEYLKDVTNMHCVKTEQLPRQLLLLLTANESAIEEILEIDKRENNYLSEVQEILDFDQDGEVCYSDLEILPTIGWVNVHDILMFLQSFVFGVSNESYPQDNGNGYYDEEEDMEYYDDHDEL